jgi:hypothetical protein
VAKPLWAGWLVLAMQEGKIQDPLGEVAWKQKLPDELGSNIIVSVVVKFYGYISFNHP